MNNFGLMNTSGMTPTREELEMQQAQLGMQDMPPQRVISQAAPNQRMTSGAASTYGTAGMPTPVPPQAIPEEPDDSAAIIKQINDSNMSSVTDAATARKVGDGWVLQDAAGKDLNKTPVTMADVKRMGRMRQPSTRVSPGDVMGDVIGGLMPERVTPQSRGRSKGSTPQNQQTDVPAGLAGLQSVAANQPPRRPAPEMRSDPMGPVDVLNQNYGVEGGGLDYRDQPGVENTRAAQEQYMRDLEERQRYEEDVAKYGGESPYTGQGVDRFVQQRQDNPINRSGLARGPEGETMFDDTYMQKRYGEGVKGGLSDPTGYRSDTDPRQVQARKEAEDVQKRRMAYLEQAKFNRQIEQLPPAQQIAALNARQKAMSKGGMSPKEALDSKLAYAKFRNTVEQQGRPDRKAHFEDTYEKDPITGLNTKVGSQYGGYTEDGQYYTRGDNAAPGGLTGMSAQNQQTIKDTYDKILNSKDKDANMSKFKEYLSKYNISDADLETLIKGE